MHKYVIGVVVFVGSICSLSTGVSVTSCSGAVCGVNARCTPAVGGSRPVCSCLPMHIGDPLYQCTPVECIDNEDCKDHLSCSVNNKCVSPCEGACGVGARCDVTHHHAVCSCPPGLTGNPQSSCRQMDPPNPCHPSPCGLNTECTERSGVPVCRCLPNFFGSPLTGCRRECVSDVECGPTQHCVDFKCRNSCDQCGKGADCTTVNNHIAVCTCPLNYKGNPYEICQPECVTHSECPGSKPACYNNKCQNPCEGACGLFANCELRSLTPICSCPRDMTGDPFTACRPFEKIDLCEPNPCGPNAKCQPGTDRSGKERPVCTCLPGFFGNGVTGCTRGECETDDQCADNRACNDNQCTDPCIGQCGANAECSPRRHLAVCTCPPGFTGDSLTHCYARNGRSYDYGRSYNNYGRVYTNYGRSYNARGYRYY